MTGGTDQDCGETYLEQAQDAIYGIRASIQLMPWSTIIAGIGMALMGLAQHNTAYLASGVTAVVVAFIPRARPTWVYEVARTWAIKQGWAAVPAGERPLRTPDEILGVRFPVLPERERPN